jgi:hypothetical protein
MHYLAHRLAACKKLGNLSKIDDSFQAPAVKKPPAATTLCTENRGKFAD